MKKWYKKWYIFFELLTMIIIGSAVLWAIALLASWATYGDMPVASYKKAWDFFKFVGGPLLGTGIAFYVNDQVRRERQQEAEEAAVLGAAFSMGTMYADFIEYRYAVRNMVADCHRQMKPNAEHPIAIFFNRIILLSERITIRIRHRFTSS